MEPEETFKRFSQIATCTELVADVGKLREIRGVFGNLGSIITFQVGSDDPERLAAQLGKYPAKLPPKLSLAYPNTLPASAS